jgi:hypothetical protein
MATVFNKPFILNHNAVAMVAFDEDVDFNLTSDLSLYTVPTDKIFTPFAILISQASADLASSVVSFGQASAKTDFLGNQTLSGVNAVGDACWCLPVPNATPVGIVTYTAGEVFTMDRVTAAGGAATANIAVFGLVEDA